MTPLLQRISLGVGVALLASAAWSSRSVGAVAEPTPGEKIDGSVQDRMPEGLGIEVKRRDPTVAPRALRGIGGGPRRQATPSKDAAPSESPLASAETMTVSTDTAGLPAPAPTRGEPEPAAPAASLAEPASAATPAPEPSASAEPAGPEPAQRRAVTPVETLPATTPTPAPPAPPPPAIMAQEPAAAPPGATTAAGDYKIGPEDILDIAVWNNTAISRTVPVRPDGKISLPLLHDVQAAGLTPMELREVLVKRLADYMPTPEVSVIVREVHSFKVSVLGEVKKPGQFELKSSSTVLDVIALAGGFTEFAARSRIVILRQAGATVKRVPFNYNNALSPGARPEDLFLRPGDVVVVP